MARPLINFKFRSERWSCPPAGVYKINVDSVFFIDSGKASVGVVARDHFGLMIDGYASTLHGTFNAELVEPVALSEGLKFAVSNGWTQVQIEGDSIGIINKLLSQEADRSIAVMFLLEARQILKNNPGFKVSHVSRKALLRIRSLIVMSLFIFLLMFLVVLK